MTRKSLIAAGLAVVVVSATACGGGGGTAGAPTGSDRPVTVAIAVEPVSLDPCDTQDATNAIVVRGNVTESLTRIDPENGTVVGLLAESWEQKDPTTWVFTLKSGVTFQDGAPFDATAAATSITRLLDPELNCQNLDQFPQTMTLTAVDATTLQVTTPEPDPILPLRISYADISSPNTPADSKTSSPIGTGPFSFVSSSQGQSIQLKRNDSYWGDAPEATAVTYLFRAEPSVRAGMARTGEASIASAIAVQDATDDDRTREYNDNRVFFLRTQTDRAPFDDIRVRQAVAYAIDKNTIVQALMERSGTPTDQIITSTVNGFVPGYTAPVFDPAKAKSLIAEAAADGVAVTTEFDLVTRPDLFPGADEVIQAIVQNLQQVGLNVKIVSLDTDAWLQLLRAPFPPDQRPTIVAISHDNVSGDASFTFPKYMASDGTNSTIRSPEIDDLLARADVAGGEERAALYQQANAFEQQEVAAMIPIASQSKLMMLAEGIEYQPNSLSGVELRIADVHFTTDN
ncbi:hypothetical protein JL107_08105 [Nakamurella flavida]|uniref:Solute-binding protein family 5 domain-containing protein n=1 Tax=Nakamurella flavida TaxID=363630 RepID=A0A939C2B8_9ACTN|nr:ABC transporter substrate-binding protein [Nakamurella flavida]MBM9476400.1 hypothetical protein [Nakamurella flavida]MDP9779499.1 peptide/nickel transport system substrate-binding protein [Nakamurella flavida]